MTPTTPALVMLLAGPVTKTLVLFTSVGAPAIIHRFLLAIARGRKGGRPKRLDKKKRNPISVGNLGSGMSADCFPSGHVWQIGLDTSQTVIGVDWHDNL